MKISHIIIYDIYKDGIILLELYMICFLACWIFSYQYRFY